jgi:hypothetical protein
MVKEVNTVSSIDLDLDVYEYINMQFWRNVWTLYPDRIQLVM